jgi:hypothetical protein
MRACTVEKIPRREAHALIRRYEFLGTVGRAALFIGLRAPDGRVLSLVGFGTGPHAAGGDAVLERGMTRRRAPRNSGSYLLSRALRWGVRHLGWRSVKAYTDPRFGERGLVYRAAGFQPWPSSHVGGRYALVEGARTLSDRAIFRRFGSHAAARAAGATIVRLPARQAWEWRP